jgi:hypothetical protein
VEGLIFVSLLFGLTVAIVAVDKSRRRASGQAAAIRDPDWSDVLIRTLLINFIALPYYFHQTRGTGLARLAGFGLFFVVFLISLGAMLALVVAKL